MIRFYKISKYEHFMNKHTKLFNASCAFKINNKAGKYALNVFLDMYQFNISIVNLFFAKIFSKILISMQFFSITIFFSLSD